MSKFVLAFICAVLLQKCVLGQNSVDASSENGVNDNLASGFKVVYRAYQHCERLKMGDLFTCLKMRALKFVDRALRSNMIPVVDGITIVRSFSTKDDRSGRVLNTEPLKEISEENLPADPKERQVQLDEMLVERLGRFIQTHTIQFDMARFFDEAQELLNGSEGEGEGEGRKKGKDKYGGIMILAGMMKAGMMAFGMKGLGLLAGKALIVAKIALVLSAIVGLSKLVGGGGGGGDEKTTYEIIKHPHVSHAHTYSSSYVDGGHGHEGGHDHYKRSLEVPEAAMYPHLLAYRGQQQAQQSPKQA